MNELQFQSGARHVLSTIGAIGGTVAMFSPQWGGALQVAATTGGYALAGIMALWGVFSPVKAAATGLTGEEATAALNNASLAKAKQGFAN